MIAKSIFSVIGAFGISCPQKHQIFFLSLRLHLVHQYFATWSSDFFSMACTCKFFETKIISQTHVISVKHWTKQFLSSFHVWPYGKYGNKARSENIISSQDIMKRYRKRKTRIMAMIIFVFADVQLQRHIRPIHFLYRVQYKLACCFKAVAVNGGTALTRALATLKFLIHLLLSVTEWQSVSMSSTSLTVFTRFLIYFSWMLIVFAWLTYTGPFMAKTLQLIVFDVRFNFNSKKWYSEILFRYTTSLLSIYKVDRRTHWRTIVIASSLGVSFSLLNHQMRRQWNLHITNHI